MSLPAGILPPLIHINLSLWQAGVFVLCMTQYLGISVDIKLVIVILRQALLLLIQLTKGNANIQKIVAFENAFDRLFDVISEEGYADGGIVVEDCLLLMLNLLRNNTSNQNFFKEGNKLHFGLMNWTFWFLTSGGFLNWLSNTSLVYLPTIFLFQFLPTSFLSFVCV